MYNKYTSSESIASMRIAWTVIELIFIIILIGILAAVAIPKLAATRDDAKLATDVSNMSRCITKAASIYVASGSDITQGDSESCDAVKCYNITYSSGGLNFIVVANPNAENYCSNVNEIGAHLAKTYTFKGTNVIY